MSKNIEHVQHLKSNVVINGGPKLPNSSALTEGEIAVNYASGYETLSIKNASGDVKSFSSDDYYTEKKLGSAFTSGNSAVTVTEAIENSEEVSISSGVTPSGTSIEIWIDESEDPAEADVYTKAQTDSLLNLKLDTSAYTEYWTSGTGENAVVLKNSSGTASGDFSVAEGYQTSATSNYSHTEGGNTLASGDFSHAEGYSTKASGSNSHAEGNATKANGVFSHAEGQGTTASGFSSHAEGAGTTAIGGQSHAEGVGTTASGTGSHAEGNQTLASVSFSHAEGQGTLASGLTSHAEGQNTKASGDYSHAEGVNTTASGLHSHSEGNYTTASGLDSHAEGRSTIASGDYGSHAEGYETIASGYSSHAEGEFTKANGNYSHAEGMTTSAMSTASHAEGGFTKANGWCSHAEGEHTIANNVSEHASGQYNVSSSASTTFGDSGNTLFSVGNGTSDSNRKNAFEIRQNGNIYIIRSGSTVLLQDEIGNIVIDQVIDSGTSASTNAVSTSAVYGFVTSYTPSITVDQVLDNTTSASTNPVSSKAVYDAVTDNELVWTNAFVALSGTVSAHTENTEIHVTAADKTKWNAVDNKLNTSDFNTYSGNVDTAIGSKAAQSDLNTLSGTVTGHTADTTIHLTSTEKGQLHTHSNKSALDSITGNVGTMAYENTSSYSSATEVNTALGNKANTTDLSNFFDDAKYEDSGTTKVINFYHGNTIKATIDATDFIVDGMVDDVRIENGNLVIDFNTASGKQDINIPISDIFDASNYYTKQNIDDKLGTGFSISSVTEVIKENELVTSEALNDLDGRIGSGFSVSSVTKVMESKADKEEDLDGVKLKKITQSAYDALEQAGTLDPNTLYIITDDNS